MRLAGRPERVDHKEQFLQVVVAGWQEDCTIKRSISLIFSPTDEISLSVNF
jgi:hypothetical protein